ncbi:hypothetical protein ACYO9G_00120 [Staphylococcus aureus]
MQRTIIIVLLIIFNLILKLLYLNFGEPLNPKSTQNYILEIKNLSKGKLFAIIYLTKGGNQLKMLQIIAMQQLNKREQQK